MIFRGYPKAVFALTIAALTLVACAPTVRVSKLRPARISAAAHLDKITVLTFEGPNGKQVSRRLKETLEDIYVDGEPYFHIVGEDTFYELASGKRCRACRKEKHMLSLARATGADAVLAGSVTESSCTAELYEEKETRCTQLTVFKKDEKPVCTQWADFYIPCVKNTATYEFEVRLVEITTGHYLYTDSFSSTRQGNACPKNRSAGSYRATLIELTGSRQSQSQCRADWKKELINIAYEDAIASAEKKIPQSIAPYYVSTKIPLMTSTKGIRDAKAKDLFTRAIKLARTRNLTTACRLWKEGAAASPESASLSYNLGVCAEFKKDLKLAKQFYREAAGLLGESNDMILAAFERIARNKKDMNILSEQLNEQEKNRRRKTKE